MSSLTSPLARLRRRGRGHFASDRGVALVEFALVLPFLLLVAFGMVDLGKAVSYWNDQTHLANQAARYAAVNSCSACSSSTPPTISQYTRNQAESAELKAALSAGPPAGNVAIQFPEQTGGTPVPQNHCIGHSVKVIVTYKYKFLPFLSDHIGIGDVTITASSTMRLEKNWGDSSGNYRPGVDAYDATGASHDSC